MKLNQVLAGLSILLIILIVNACRDVNTGSTGLGESLSTSGQDNPVITAGEVQTILNSQRNGVWEFELALNTSAIQQGSVTTSSITMLWSAVDGVKEYLILRWNFTTGEWALWGLANSGTFTDSNLSAATKYRYVVMPLDRPNMLYGFSAGSVDITTSSNASSSNTSGTSKLTVQTLSSSALKNGSFLGDGANVSSVNSFTLDSNTISFQISLFGKELSGFTSLITPQGVDLLSASNIDDYYLLPIRPAFASGFSTLLVPTLPDHKATAGTWKYQLLTNGTSLPDIKLVTRSGSTPTNSVLTIKPYLTGTKFSASNLTAPLQVLKETFAAANITANVEAIQVLTDTKYASIQDNFESANSAALVSLGDKDKVNLFFVQDLVGSDGSSLLGLAAGIPGSQGIAGRYNGVFINLSTHVLSTSGTKLDDELLGETAAHEMGHWLGLYHTSEETGTSFDPLDDTPECDASFDKNKNESLSVTECLTRGADNLMFWVGGSTGFIQRTLSTKQAYILNYSVIAK